MEFMWEQNKIQEEEFRRNWEEYAEGNYVCTLDFMYFIS